MLFNAGTLAVELVVFGARKLLGALGAVVAAWAAGAKGSGTLSTQGRARSRAGEDALGEHFGRLVEWRWGATGCWRVVVGDGLG